MLTLCNKYNIYNCKCINSILMFVYADSHIQPYQLPDEVSFSFGGPGAAEYFVIETHYNNPSNVLSELFAQ